MDKKGLTPKTNGDSPQPSSSGPPSGAACPRSAYHKQLAALNCSVRDWIAKHVNANPLCDLTPIFRDYERHLAGIELQHGSGGGRGSEREAAPVPPATPSPPLFGAAKPQQDPAFPSAGGRAEDGAERKTEPPAGAASASFSFGKKIDGSVLGSLSSGPLTGFSFSSGNSSFFGKELTQNKPASSPFSAQTLEVPAEGGTSDLKGNNGVHPPESVSEPNSGLAARPWLCGSGASGSAVGLAAAGTGSRTRESGVSVLMTSELSRGAG